MNGVNNPTAFQGTGKKHRNKGDFPASFWKIKPAADEDEENQRGMSCSVERLGRG